MGGVLDGGGDGDGGGAGGGVSGLHGLELLICYGMVCISELRLRLSVYELLCFLWLNGRKFSSAGRDVLYGIAIHGRWLRVQG